LTIEVELGETLDIAIGDPAICRQEITVPEVDGHALRDFAPDTPDLPEPPVEARVAPPAARSR